MKKNFSENNKSNNLIKNEKKTFKLFVQDEGETKEITASDVDSIHELKKNIIKNIEKNILTEDFFILNKRTDKYI
jgi:hypothetical protein